MTTQREEENARGVYDKRRGRQADIVRRRASADARIANLRLVAGLSALPLAWMIWVRRDLHPAWILVPVVAYVALAIVHDRVIQIRKRAERLVRYYDFCIARLSDAWIGKGDAGAEFGDPRHPYAEDLDLFGIGSVFELLCTAQTPFGRRVLAGWLLEPAAAGEVRGRQEAVVDLRDRLDLRDSLVVLDAGAAGEGAKGGVGGEAQESSGKRRAKGDLRAWAVAPPSLSVPLAAGMSGLLALLALVAAAGWAFLGAGPKPLVVVAMAELMGTMAMRARVHEVVREFEGAAQSLTKLTGVIRCLEEDTFHAGILRGMQSEVRSEGVAASRRIAQLARLADQLEWRKNAIFAIPAFLLMWEIHHAVLIDRWRRHHGAAVGRWLDAVGNFDALCALASHAFEHPDDAFPEIRDGEVLYEAAGIGHPLIPAARCVRNNVRIDPTQRMLVVSGSNMSGKSTFLRSVGVNAVLAFAGAPVRAFACRIAPVHVGASIRRNDSLLEGVSRFYAEIQRLRQLADIAGGGRTLLFLIDEILSGTNSHDRRIGAQGVLRALLERGAIGLVTTHDLALTRIADGMAGLAVNVHFEDRIEGDEILFDYRLLPGVVTKSNALALMRTIGLPVVEEE
jgi:hypothetical protein